MITGEFEDIKDMVFKKLCKAKNPFDLMRIVCDLMDKFTDEDAVPDWYVKNFQKDTKALLERDMENITDIDALAGYIDTMHNSYVSACAMALLTNKC